MKAPLPKNEKERLKTLHNLNLLDTEAEREFDELTAMAAKICNTPVALISLVDKHRQWFKSKVSLDVNETDRDVAFCAHSILTPDQIMEVQDAYLDPRFADNLLVTEGPKFRFYAGVPLVAQNGHALGTLCVLDYKPGRLSSAQRLSLETLGRLAVREIELRDSYHRMKKLVSLASDDADLLLEGLDRDSMSLQQELNARVQFELMSRRILDATLDAVISIDCDGKVIYWNPNAEIVLGYTALEAQGKSIIELTFEPSEYEAAQSFLSQFFVDKVGDSKSERLEFDVVRADGVAVSVEVSLVSVRRFGESIVTGFVRDVTDRNKDISNLRIAAMTFDGAEGILITDGDFNIVRANKSSVDITGYSENEQLGSAPQLLRPDQHEAEFLAAIWESVKQDDTWAGEVWERRKNWEAVPLHLTISVIRDSKKAIQNYLFAFSDRSRAKKDADEIYSLAFFDALTGLPNRRLLMDRLNQTIATIGRVGKKAALLFIDIDNFKDLNDHLGHDFGDLLLQQMAERLTVGLRSEDTVARIGGDEFVIILRNLGEDDVDAPAQTRDVATKILSLLQEPYTLKDREFFSTVSIGATLIEQSEVEAEELIKQADIAMYQSKKAGRNMFRFFDPQMQKVINQRASIEHALHEAIEKKQFRLYYQIQFNAKNIAVGSEALIRWNNPLLGVVSPLEFIPLAEESGLIIPIGNWVMQEACNQISCWKDRGRLGELTVSINISPRQFYHPNFISETLACLKRTGIDPRKLTFELTEGLVLKQVDDAISIIRELKRIGISFAIDDFGTGYSSLQYISNLPLSQLKIDQSFVRNMHVNHRPTVIIETIISMSRSLGLEVVAEGVETQEQYELLKSFGCQVFQGYYFSKPVPAAEFEKLVS